MNFLACFFMLLSFVGCAALPERSISKVNSIGLNDIEQLKMGVTTLVQIQKLFGPPTQVLTTLFKNEDVWVYDSVLNGDPVPKASFTVSKKGGIVLGAAWIPFSDEDCSYESNALAHFKGLKFIKNKVEQNPHWYVDDLDYESEDHSISFKVIKPSGRVEAISFGIPQEKIRTPAKL